MVIGESRLKRVRVLPVAVAFAIGVNLLLAWVIFRMVTPGQMEPPSREALRLVDFVRLRPVVREVEARRQLRRPDKPPPKKEEPPKLPELKQPAPEKPKPQTPDLQVKTPALKLPFKIAGGPSVGIAGPTAPAVPAAAPIGGDEGPALAAPVEIEEHLTPTYRAPPPYPPRALRAGIEGVVTVEFTITDDGSVRDPRVVRSDPPQVFDDTVLKTILKWKFNPKVVDGKAVERRARQDVRFTLNKR
jgi:protein TonB